MEGRPQSPAPKSEDEEARRDVPERETEGKPGGGRRYLPCDGSLVSPVQKHDSTHSLMPH